MINATPLRVRDQAVSLASYSFTVPSANDTPIRIHTSNCSSHCSPDLWLQPRRCLRTNDDIPLWGTRWQDETGADVGDVYESYECLACLNVASMMARSTHPEFGNDERETQDFVNAIWDVSKEAGIPPYVLLSSNLSTLHI